MKVSLILLSTLAFVAAGNPTNYAEYKLVRTSILNTKQSLTLQKYEEEFDFWRPARPGMSADIMVPPGTKFLKFAQNMRREGIDFSVIIPDIGAMIENQKSAKSAPYDGKISFDQYYPHDDLNAYIDDLAAANDFINTVSIGQSHEGRDMRVLQITKAGPGKPNVWIEAGIHAREWIAPAMATFIIDSLLKNETTFINDLNFHILPSANPDGYMYSREHDRMWRKTRSDYGSIFLCKGVDPNRNWDYHFAESGASNNKCTDTYHGPEAFSEVETRNIRDYVLALDPVPVLAECFHSYSQLWLWPYGYAYNAYPENYQEIKTLAEEAVVELEKVHGKKFDPINSADLYPAAGASDDWYKGVLGARFAYTVELRDTGLHGFILPPDQIQPSGEELWAAHKLVFQRMIDVSNE